MVIAAACSVLRETATFATALGRFARTFLQLCFHVRITYGASQSFCVKIVKDRKASGSMTCGVCFFRFV